MSTVNDQTSYILDINMNRDGEDAGAGRLTFPASGGTTDSIAIAAYQALLGVPWDPTVNVNISLMKVDDSQTTYTPDLTQTPPAFI